MTTLQAVHVDVLGGEADYTVALRNYYSGGKDIEVTDTTILSSIIFPSVEKTQAEF